MNFVQGVYRKNRQTGNGVKAEVRTGNLFTDGHFATNSEMERIRQEEIAASFRNMMAYTESRLDSGNIYADASKMGPNGDFMPVYDKNGMKQLSEAEFDAAMKRGNVDPALAEKYKKAYYSESEQPKQDGNNSTFSPEVLSQDPGGPLSQMFQKVFGYGPTQADRLAGSACMANATYTALRMSGANVGTEEDFYRNHLGTDIDSETGWLNRSTADIAKQYEKEQISFYDYDKIGEQDFDYGKATFEKWSEQKQKYIEHTVTINKGSDGNVRIFSDTGKNSSGNNGMNYKKVIGKDKFVRFQYIKK